MKLGWIVTNTKVMWKRYAHLTCHEAIFRVPVELKLGSQMDCASWLASPVGPFVCIFQNFRTPIDSRNQLIFIKKIWTEIVFYHKLFVARYISLFINFSFTLCLVMNSMILNPEVIIQTDAKIENFEIEIDSLIDYMSPNSLTNVRRR